MLAGEWNYSDYRQLFGNGTTWQCAAPNRYKIRQYKAQWSQLVDRAVVLSFYVQYGVCYVPNGNIAWSAVWPAWNTSAIPPWTWITTNDNGFPTQDTWNQYVTFRWQGSAAIWPTQVSPTKHPGLQITFYPNNTETKNAWSG